MADNEEFSEGRARDVAEHAREAEWRQPSFGKELFLGRLRLDLVHPHPTGSPKTAERGEAFLAKLREFCESQIDAAVIERDAQIPDKVILGFEGTRRVRHEDRHRVRRARPVAGVLQQGSRAGLLRASRVGRVAIRAPVDRGAAADFDVRNRGAEAERGCRGVHRRSAHSSSPSPTSGSDPARLHATATPDGDDYVLNGVKLWTTNGVIADLMVVMAKVPKSEDHRRWDHRTRGGGGYAGHRGGEPQCVHGVARHRKRPHPVHQRAGAGGQPHRPTKAMG